MSTTKPAVEVTLFIAILDKLRPSYTFETLIAITKGSLGTNYQLVPTESKHQLLVNLSVIVEAKCLGQASKSRK